jgi:iron complex outermembrane receptor protein
MRTRSNFHRYLLTTAGLTSLFVGMTAERAVAADGIETVTVTARRQEESLLDAPVTVTALGGEDLRNRGISDIQQIIQFIPNAVVPDDPQHFTTFINIRGIRQVDAQSEPNVGIYRNGIYYGGQRTNFGSLVDLQRMEVLRGPQAGLYGRDAVGGSVNAIYATPTNEGGYASAKYGNYNRVELQGAYTVPLSDDFSVRAAGWYFNQTGSEYYNSFLHENIDRGHDYGGRLTGLADWSANANTLLTVEYEDVTGPSQRTYAPNGVPGVLNGVLSAPETPRTIQRDTPNRSAWHQFYASQNTTYDSDVGRFNLIASYRDYHLKGTEDQDQSTVDPAAAFLNLKQVLDRKEGLRDFYAEALWTSPQDQPITWLAGVSYFNETFDFARTFTTSLDLDYIGIPLGVRTARGGLPLEGTNFKTNSVSAFAEFTWKATDRVDIIGGFRWTQDRKTLNYAQDLIPTDPASDPIFAFLFASVLPPFTLVDHPKFTFGAPTFTIRWKKSDDFMLYATYGSGFRAGGFNTTTTQPSLIPYDQETAHNYELGFKSLWADGNVGINADVFLMQQNNMLLAQPDPLSPPAFGFTYLANVGSGTTYGAELEVLAQITDWLSGYANLGLLDPQFDKGFSFGSNLADKMIPYTRKLTFNIGFSLDHPIGDDVALVGTVNYRAERGGYLDTANTSPYESLDKVDATLGFEFDDKSVRVNGYVKNLTNDRVVQFEFGNGAVATNLGRTYGVQVSKKF